MDNMCTRCFLMDRSQVRLLSERADPLSTGTEMTGRLQVEQMRDSIAKVLAEEGDARNVPLDNGRVYTLLRRAGEGSFGTVYVAYDTVKKLNVAFKICEDQLETDRGDREAQILEKLFKLNHPNIVPWLSRLVLPGQPLALNCIDSCRKVV